MSSNNLQKNARELRNNMTKQEKHLWYDFLSKHKLRWYKQRTISNYFVDFYCAGAKLVIEIDGSQHYSEDGVEYDERRTQELEKLGLKVLRFLNSDVDCRFEAVCNCIDEVVKERVKE